MSVVTYFVETAESYLEDAASTQFGAVASTVGTLLFLGTTLVAVLVFINMIYHLDQIALLRRPGDNGCDSRIAAAKHVCSQVESQSRFLLVFAVTVPTALFQNRGNVLLEVDLVARGRIGKQKQCERDREMAVGHQTRQRHQRLP